MRRGLAARRGVVAALLAGACLLAPGPASAATAGATGAHEDRIELSTYATGIVAQGDRIAVAFECDVFVRPDLQHFPDPLRVELECTLEGPSGVLISAPRQDVHLSPVALTAAAGEVAIQPLRVCAVVVVRFVDATHEKETCTGDAVTTERTSP